MGSSTGVRGANGVFSWPDHVIAEKRWQCQRNLPEKSDGPMRRTDCRGGPAGGPCFGRQLNSVARNRSDRVQVSMMATAWPSATTSSILTRIDLSLPGAGEA